MMQLDRRHRRSNETSEALFFQLDTSRARSNLDAVVLVDDEGLCVSSAGEGMVCEEIAAHVALIGERVPCFDGILFSESDQWDIYMERMAVAGEQLYVCAVGGSKKSRAEEVTRTANGATRILFA